MGSRRVVVVGGGAAGFFAAITCAEAKSETEVTILERGPQFLSKVRISGGGRCNVTHACFDPKELTAHYPRGGKELMGPFTRFQPRDTIQWFASRGVTLKTERDGRLFPTTDSSETVIDCLIETARTAAIQLLANKTVLRITKTQQARFELDLSDGGVLDCDRLLLATGGCRTHAACRLSEDLGHTIEPPVPSLFALHLDTPWLKSLAGISVANVEARVPGTPLRASGPLMVTHSGVSGPAVLRLSSWGARVLHDCGYQFPLLINWVPQLSTAELEHEIAEQRDQGQARLVVNTPMASLPARLWEELVIAAGIDRRTRWAGLARTAQLGLLEQLIRTKFQATGKSLNKEEFVTCGGVRLSEVSFKTMGSRVCEQLYFAGEVLDIDGLTGGFNFQAAWTTGWIAGHEMAGA